MLEGEEWRGVGKEGENKRVVRSRGGLDCGEPDVCACSPSRITVSASEATCTQRLLNCLQFHLCVPGVMMCLCAAIGGQFYALRCISEALCNHQSSMSSDRALSWKLGDPHSSLGPATVLLGSLGQAPAHMGLEKPQWQIKIAANSDGAFTVWQALL